MCLLKIYILFLTLQINKSICFFFFVFIFCFCHGFGKKIVASQFFQSNNITLIVLLFSYIMLNH